MKILYVTTIGGTMAFFIDYIDELVSKKHVVDIATNTNLYPVREIYNDLGCSIFNISCTRSPFSLSNITAIKQIKKIVEEGNYDIVHCHTPIAAACTRIACRKARKKGTKVIYTAHGFHFYKGAPLINWLVFYPIEKLCAHFTDILVTINKEDYNFALKKIKAKRVEYVPGVGIDVQKFANCEVDALAKKQELGVPNDAFLLLSVGELNENKNHQSVIRALAKIENKNPHYIIAGEGGLKDNLISLTEELGVKDRVHLVGQRDDVAELYKVADVYIHPSYREGLPVAVVEALAAGTPIICTNIRGNTDVVKDGINGVLVKPNAVDEIKKAINKLMTDKGEIGKTNSVDAECFSVSSVNEKMYNIYSD